VPIVCFLPIRLSKSRGVENDHHDHHLLLKILGQLSVDLFLYFCPHCIVQLLSAVFTISAIVVSASIFFAWNMNLRAVWQMGRKHGVG
jgi:hypothetical protein